jgi:hypothetical protein
MALTIIAKEERAMSTDNDNKVLVHRWFEEIWNKGREAAIDEMLANDCAVHGLGTDMHGPERVQAVPFGVSQCLSRHHSSDR